MRSFVFTLCTMMTPGCLTMSDPSLVLEPDGSRTGEDGEDGPYGAAWVESHAQARLRDSVTYTVVYPALQDGSPDTTGGPYPTLMLVHGGAVAPERYRWLAAHHASRGYVSVMPEHDLDLAIFGPANGLYALDHYHTLVHDSALEGLGDPEGPSAAMGHSLGGVVAAMGWLDEPSLHGLALLASYPVGGAEADLSAQEGRPVLGLAGETDGSLPPDEMQTKLSAFPQPATYAVVQGMNHYAWCDDATDQELADDGPLEGDLDGIRQHAQHVLDSWLDATLRDDNQAAERLDDRAFEGVTWP